MLDEFKKIKGSFQKLTKFIPHKIGEVPGEVRLEKMQLPDLEMSLIKYNQKNFSQDPVENLAQLELSTSKNDVNWLIVNGFGGEEFVQTLKDKLGIHKLIVEDILSVNHPPKLEFYEEPEIIFLRILFPTNKKASVSLSIVVLENTLVLFSPSGSFFSSKRIIERINSRKGIIRGRSVDYLLFALLDVAVDSYFPSVDIVSNAIKEIDRGLFDDKQTHLVSEIKSVRQILSLYYDNLFPLKELIYKLVSSDKDFVLRKHVKYYNDCLDHITYLCDRIKRLKESTSDIMNLHISLNGQKMNEIMKVLTMMSSIFIPLSFICGLYGMNFDTSKSPLNMPELSWYYGYPIIISLMVVLVLSMLFYFHRKKWF